MQEEVSRCKARWSSNPRLDFITHHLEHGAIGVLEAHHADGGPTRAVVALQRGDDLDAFGEQGLIGLIDVINDEGDTRDTDVVKRRVGLTLRRRIDELHEVEHRSLGVITEAHEHTAKLPDRESKGFADTGGAAAEKEIGDLGKPEVLLGLDRAFHLADANIDVKESAKHTPDDL